MSVFDQIAADLRGRVAGTEGDDKSRILIPAKLYELLNSRQWNADDWSIIDQAARKLDVTRRVDEAYSRDWKSLSEAELGEPWRSVFALVLCQALFEELGNDSQSGRVLKRLNVAYKAIDYLARIDPESAQHFSEALESLDIRFAGRKVPATLRDQGSSDSSGTKILPLTVLFSEGPIARAYLETIASQGLRPRKIIQLVSAVDIATGRERLKWLPATLRKTIAAGMQRNQIFHWPLILQKRFPIAAIEIIEQVGERFDIAEATIRQAQQNKPLIEYSDQVETLLVRNLHDESLLECVRNEEDKEFLFTGGGIVPSSLLSVTGSKFIHIHPGYLPDVRGADCLLYSILANGRPSASAFYMAPGIDTGDILLAQWLPELQLPAIAEADLATHYRLAYSLVDPWVRAVVLRELLNQHSAFAALPGLPQKEADGTTYHFMHDKLRRMALDRLFSRS